MTYKNYLFYARYAIFLHYITVPTSKVCNLKLLHDIRALLYFLLLIHGFIQKRCCTSSLPMTVVVPSGATKEAGANPYAEKLPISPSTIKIMPNLKDFHR